jgi:hypothetical protein
LARASQKTIVAKLRATDYVQEDLDCDSWRAEDQVKQPGPRARKDDLDDEEEEVKGSSDQMISPEDEAVPSGQSFGRFLMDSIVRRK